MLNFATNQIDSRNLRSKRTMLLLFGVLAVIVASLYAALAFGNDSNAAEADGVTSETITFRR